MSNRVLEFIKRRFPQDSNWLNGNCYYFALILSDRFDGEILYDVIDGHFVTLIDGIKYDWEGIVPQNGIHKYIKWNDFDKYDKYQKKSVISGCIK